MELGFDEQRPRASSKAVAEDRAPVRGIRMSREAAEANAAKSRARLAKKAEADAEKAEVNAERRQRRAKGADQRRIDQLEKRYGRYDLGMLTAAHSRTRVGSPRHEFLTARIVLLETGDRRQAEGPGRRKWTLADRIEVWSTYNGMCGICMEKVPKPGSVLWYDDITQPLYPVLDHVRPLAQGGTDVLQNLQIAHWRCNAVKGKLLG